MRDPQPNVTKLEKYRSNIRVLAVVTFLCGMRNSMFNAIWQPFVLSLGASMPMLGLLESIGGFRGIVTNLIQPIGGWLSDRQGRVTLLLWGNLLAAFGLACNVIGAVSQNWHFLLPGIILLGLSQMARPVQDAMISESSAEKRRGGAYSLVSFAFASAGIFAALLAGYLADRLGYVAVFVTGIAFQIICVVLVSRFLQETRLAQGERALQWAGLKGVFTQVFAVPKHLRAFYIATTVDSVVWGAGAGIFFGMLRKTYHFSPFQFGLLSSIGSISWAVSQLPLGRLIDKHGRVKFLILSEVLGAVMMVGWLFSSRFESFAVLQVINGLVPATWIPAMLSWMSEHVPDDQRAEEMGRLSAFRGIVAFPSPYIGGLLYESLGFSGPVVLNLVGALLAALLFALFVPERAQR